MWSWTDTAGPNTKRGPVTTQPTVPAPLMPQGQPRPWVLGPCYRCGGFETVYPLCQPVVSSAEMSQGLSSPVVCVEGCSQETDCPSACVDNARVEAAALQVVSKQSVNDHKGTIKESNCHSACADKAKVEAAVVSKQSK